MGFTFRDSDQQFIHQGFRGIANIGGTLLRFETADISAKQAINAPDLVMGHEDRMAYNYGAITYDGTISGPITEDWLGATNIFDWACYRGEYGSCSNLEKHDIHLYYYCNRDKLFTDCLVNTLDFSATAGEAANYSLGVIALNSGDGPFGDAAPPNKTNPEKIVTWENLDLTINTSVADDKSSAADLADIAIQAFTININNNITPQYSLGQPDLTPYDLVHGLRSISGSITAFDVPKVDGVKTFDEYCAGNEATLEFKLETTSCGGATIGPIVVRARFDRIQPSLSSGILTSTVTFTGVSAQTGAPWTEKFS
jgi:hypothetical protein